MSVDDHGLEAIRKSAIQLVSGSKAEYALRMTSVEAFQVPKDADAFTVELQNSDLDVVYKFRQGGVGGTVLATITLTYATPQTLTVTQGVMS